MNTSADGMIPELGFHAGVGEERHQDRVGRVWKKMFIQVISHSVSMSANVRLNITIFRSDMEARAIP